MSIDTGAQVAIILLACRPCVVIVDYWDKLYLGRAPRTKETLPDFREWCRVTRHLQVFRGLTGCQRTLGFWGVTIRTVIPITRLERFLNMYYWPSSPINKLYIETPSCAVRGLFHQLQKTILCIKVCVMPRPERMYST